MRMQRQSALLTFFVAMVWPAAAQVTLVDPAKAGAAATSQAPQSPSLRPVPSDGSILPPAFSGWQKDPNSERGTDPARAHTAEATLLKEAGLGAFERATYTRQGRKLSLQAFRFNDATGAFAAYSALQTEPMAKEKFCNHARSSGTHIQIACADIVIDVQYDKVTAMTAAELRSLASLLPRATGNRALPANAPLHLPKDGVSDVRLALGPAGLAKSGTPLPADIIDFSKSAEVAVGTYPSDAGSALVTIVKYPTFALATERQKAFDLWAKSQGQLASTFFTRRVGPIVVLVSGNISEPDARNLAEQVPYDVEITQSEPVYTPKDNIGNLVVNMMYLSFIIIGFTFVTGLAFGGFRILAKKYFPGRFVDRPEDVEFIKLDIGD
ncbi:MAG TPA: DUF6599 family protein [Terriglobales bacterium]|nr:DUF6599 family protein [Terriglobales bacterium]